MKVNKMKKALSILLTLVMMVGMMPVVSFEAEAATENVTIFLKPNSNWMQANARFATYSWDNDGSGWVDLKDDNNDGYYEADIPNSRTGIIFFRMDPGNLTNNFTWSGAGGPVWNRIGNIAIDAEKNCYTMNEDSGLWSVENESGDTTSGSWSHKHIDDSTGKCSVCGAYVDGIGAKLAGYSLSLSGNIGVNFHMELDSSVLNDETARMHFTLPNGNEKDVYVKDIKSSPAVVLEKTYYVFSCEVAAKEMTKEIKAQMVIDEEGNEIKGTEYTYTVQQYAEAILENPVNYAPKDKDDELMTLVQALLEYGSYSQQYFAPSVAAEDLADVNLGTLGYTPTDLSEIDDTDLVQFKYTTDTSKGTLAELGIAYATLELESKTALNVYYTPKAGVTGISATINDNAASIEDVNGTYVINVSDIIASQLDTEYSFTITGTVDDASKTWSLKEYSALSYCYEILNAYKNTAEKAALVNVAKALYLYNMAANSYFAN